MEFMGYDADRLADIVREHEILKHLKDTPSYQSMLAQANIDFLISERSKIDFKIRKAEAKMRTAQEAKGRPKPPPLFP